MKHNPSKLARHAVHPSRLHVHQVTGEKGCFQTYQCQHGGRGVLLTVTETTYRQL